MSAIEATAAACRATTARRAHGGKTRDLEEACLLSSSSVTPSFVAISSSVGARCSSSEGALSRARSGARSVRTRARQIERAIAGLEKELHRAPTDEEIAKKLGVTEEELDDSLLEISRSSVGALDELWSPAGGGGDSIALIDTIEDESGPDPEASLEQTEVKEALAEAISDLPEREKLVVTLYYYEELTLREIGEVLGVTESRVSQLHTKAILRLKAHLSGAAREPAET